MLHQVQGGYYVKGFGKHGPLHNPYTYGYFDHVPYTDFRGGHVTCGGIVYQGDAFPTQFRDQYIAGNLLSNAVYWHDWSRTARRSRPATAASCSLANDTWFRPDRLPDRPGRRGLRRRLVRPAGQPRRPRATTGTAPTAAIYKIEANGRSRRPTGASTCAQAVERASWSSCWRTPTTGTSARPAGSWPSGATPAVVPAAEAGRCEAGPNSPWRRCGRCTSAAASTRRSRSSSSTTPTRTSAPGPSACWATTAKCRLRAPAHALVDLARTEPSPLVRSQLACTAQAAAGGGRPADRPRAAAARRGRATTPTSRCCSGGRSRTRRSPTATRCSACSTAARPGRRRSCGKFIVERLGRRYLAEGSDDGPGRLCPAARRTRPDRPTSSSWSAAWRRPCEGRRPEQRSPAPLEKPVRRPLAQAARPTVTVLRFAFAWAATPAYDEPLRLVADAKTADADARRLDRGCWARSAEPECVPVLLTLLGGQPKPAGPTAPSCARLAAVPRPADHRHGPGLVPRTARRACAARPDAALQPARRRPWLPQGRGRRQVIPKEVAARPAPAHGRQFNDRADTTRSIEKHWGKVGADSTGGETGPHPAPVNHLLDQGTGDPAARQGAVHEALRHLPHPVRRGRQGRPRPDHRRPQEPRFTARLTSSIPAPSSARSSWPTTSRPTTAGC